jgi:dolichol-phosphate mannosyltransferase
MHSKADVTVVIPAKDEARTIGEIVRASSKYARHVIVVDGHSRDDTRQVGAAAGAHVLLDHGRGKGEAIRTAAAVVQTSVVVFIDADGSHDPDDIPRLIAPIMDGTADHVSGSRLMGGSSELHGGFEEFFRLTGSSLITACINWRFGACLSESQNGFRAIRTHVLRQLGLVEDVTTIEQEMIIKTLAKGFRMAEVPAHEYKRRFGTSHIVLWRAVPQYGISLLRHLCMARPPRPAPTAVPAPHRLSVLPPRPTEPRSHSVNSHGR